MAGRKKDCDICVPWLYVTDLVVTWEPREGLWSATNPGSPGDFKFTFRWGIEKITCGSNTGTLRKERRTPPFPRTDWDALRIRIGEFCDLEPDGIDLPAVRNIFQFVTGYTFPPAAWTTDPGAVNILGEPLFPIPCEEAATLANPSWWRGAVGMGLLYVQNTGLFNEFEYVGDPPQSVNPTLPDPVEPIFATGGNIVFQLPGPIFNIALEDTLKQPTVCCKEIPSGFGPLRAGTGGVPPTCCGLMQDSMCYCLQKKMSDEGVPGVKPPTIPPKPGDQWKYCRERGLVTKTIAAGGAPGDWTPASVEKWIKDNKGTIIGYLKYDWLKDEFKRVMNSAKCKMTRTAAPGIFDPPYNPEVPTPQGDPIGFNWSAWCTCQRQQQGSKAVIGCRKPPWV